MLRIKEKYTQKERRSDKVYTLEKLDRGYDASKMLFVRRIEKAEVPTWFIDG